jgi:hypothetical protein
MVMFTKGTTAALFAIAVASSLIVVSGGGLVGSAFAAKKGRDSAAVTNTIMTDPNGTDNSSSTKSQKTNAGDSSPTAGNPNSISGKDFKSLSKCQSDAAKDGDFTLNEVNDCYGQVFNHGGHRQGTDQPSSSSNDQSHGGQRQEQQKLSSVNGHNAETMREGFPF